MGQARARGTKDQRIAESVERHRLATAAKAERDRAEQRAWDEEQAAKQAERERTRERLNAERKAMGAPPLGPDTTYRYRTGGRRAGLSTLLAVAAIAAMAGRR